MALHDDEATSTLPHTSIICKSLLGLTVDASRARMLDFHDHCSHHAKDRLRRSLVIKLDKKRLIFSLVQASACLPPYLWATPVF